MNHHDYPCLGERRFDGKRVLLRLINGLDATLQPGVVVMYNNHYEVCGIFHKTMTHGSLAAVEETYTTGVAPESMFWGRIKGGPP